ncbi:hypothetical protein GJAV_G00090730 [Gymnothorax javanicus]|nr:hypothetical protein GJAV_G00090730 [Gymnothorax javanicus]
MDCRLIYGVTLVTGFLTLAVNGLKINSSAPVGALTMAITRDTCGQSKVCLETPANCDPSSNDTCLFVSAATASNDEGLNFELRGDSDSYVVLILSPDMMQGNDNAFVCANYKGSNFFFTAKFDNGSLTLTNKTKVKNVLVASETNVVRCTFTFRESNRKIADKYIHEPSLYIFAGNGSFTNGVLGDPVIMLMSNGSVTLSNSGSDTTFAEIPVGELTMAITRDTCGQSKVCLETPADCDPSSNDTCLFVSAATASNDEGLNFELRGDSESYVVLILSPDMMQGNDNAFVCANHKGSNYFFTAKFDNGSLTLTNKTKVKNVLVASETNVVRCTFTFRESNRKIADKYIHEPSLYIFAGNGSFTNGVLGDPVIMLRSNGSVTLSNSGSDTTFAEIPVIELTTAITRDGCGSTKYCNEVPADCDPSGTGECLFISASTSTTTKTSGTKANFEMSGTLWATSP